MERIRRRTWALDLLAAASLIAVLGPIGAHALERPVTVVCNQQEEPDPTGNFVMQFVVTNTSSAPIARLDVRLADTNLGGSPLGEFSHYAFSGTIAPGATLTRSDEVPEPPNYHTLKFSKIDCTLDRVVFADGSTWP
jgi:hypothetical protein